MEEDIYLKDVIMFLWRRKYIMVALFFGFIIGAFIYIFTVKPTYVVVGEISLGSYSDSIYTNQQSAKDILTSDDLLMNVITQLDLKSVELNDIKKHLEISTINNTSLIKISLLTKDKSEGARILDKIIEVYTKRGDLSFQSQKEILSNQLGALQALLESKEKDIADTRKLFDSIDKSVEIPSIEKDIRRSKTLEYLQSEESDRLELLDKIMELKDELNDLKGVRIIDNTHVLDEPAVPNKLLIIGIAGITGIIFGIFAAFFVDYLLRIKSKK